MTAAPQPVVWARPAHPDRSLASHLRELLSGLLAAARRVHRGGDAEAIHDLRVAARRLSAALALWAPALHPRSLVRARKDLRRLRRRLGKGREREVLQAQLEELLAGEPWTARQAAATELRRLGRRIARDRNKAARLTRASRRRKLGARIERCAASPALDDERLALAGATVSGLRDTALAVVRSALESGPEEALHRGRIAVKRWRYAAESWETVTGQADPETTARDLQRCLGAINDAWVLEDYLSRRAERHRERERAEPAQALDRLRERAGAARKRERERLASLLPAGWSAFPS